MKKILLQVITTLILVVIIAGAGFLYMRSTEPNEPPRGDLKVLQTSRLPVPISAEEQQYLGLINPGDTFLPTEIKTKLLVIEIYDLYCPYCQANAPVIKDLYNRVMDTGYSDRIKIIGLARNNSQYEAEAFKQKYNLKFPVFPDPYGKISDALDVGVTPTLICFKAGKKMKALLYNDGTLDDGEKFLNKIIKKGHL